MTAICGFSGMRREGLLAVGIAAVVVASAVAAVALPGVVAERDPGDLRPGRVSVQEVTIAPGAVSAGTATLGVTTYLDHRGGATENVTVEVRAVDLDSGMVATTAEATFGTVEGDREVRVPTNVTVAREGGYRIESVLYRGGQRVDSVAKSVEGVGTLQSGGTVQFHRFGDGDEADPHPIQFSIADAGGDRTTLDVSAYLTNRDDVPSGDLSLEFVLRQAESGIVADRATVDVGEVAPGETVTPGATVSVPAEYNYYVDAILREDAVIVDTARGVANLNPTERLDADVTVREVGLRVEDFEDDDGRDVRTDIPDRAAESPGQPGFGPLAALAALAAALIASGRWRR